MRDISPQLQTLLDTGVTTLCRCWKIARRDGTELGFTDHDGDLAIDGIRYAASSGLDANALETSTGLSVDNGQAMGALTAAAITEVDVSSGRYDGADVFNWLVNWQNVDQRVLLFRGTLGEIRRKDGAFEVELRGLAEPLNAPVGRSILRNCDRVLGDRACGADLHGPEFSTEIEIEAAGAGSTLGLPGLEAYAQDWFAAGRVEWLSGENAGILSVIRSERIEATGRRVFEFWQTPPMAWQAGDRVRVVAGCDKSAETCREKFRNFLNFRGFPHLPGEDWVTSYPMEGSVHDGSSLFKP